MTITSQKHLLGIIPILIEMMIEFELKVLTKEEKENKQQQIGKDPNRKTPSEQI